MKIVEEGDKRQVVCPNCGLTHATYAPQDIDFSDQSGTVKNVLAKAKASKRFSRNDVATAHCVL